MRVAGTIHFVQNTFRTCGLASNVLLIMTDFSVVFTQEDIIFAQRLYVNVNCVCAKECEHVW